MNRETRMKIDCDRLVEILKDKCTEHDAREIFSLLILKERFKKQKNEKTLDKLEKKCYNKL